MAPEPLLLQPHHGFAFGKIERLGHQRHVVPVLALLRRQMPRIGLRVHPVKNTGRHGGHVRRGKRVFQPGQGRHLPRGQIATECAVFEHAHEIANLAHVPPGHIAVEGAVGKHVGHQTNALRVPAGDVAIERRPREHFLHVRHTGHVPLGDVSVEGAALKHPSRGVGRLHVPARNGSREIHVQEKFTEIGNVRNIDMVQIAVMAFSRYNLAYVRF